MLLELIWKQNFGEYNRPNQKHQQTLFVILEYKINSKNY